MKVLCSACEAAEARLLCCADEAARCARCDRDVHAANHLAGKHNRLPLLPPADVSAPNCDICQEVYAYFFCVEDRALLCRACDVAVHTANAFVSAHRRFLLTGVQVGLEPDAAGAATPDADPHPPTAAAAADALQTLPPPDRQATAAAGGGGSPAPLYSDDDIDWAAGADAGVGLPDWALVHEQFGTPPVPRPADPALARTPASKRSPRRSLAAGFTVQGGGGLAGGLHDWPLDEFFGFSEYTAGLGFAENGTSKADSGKFGSTDGSPAGRSSSGASQDFFGEVPEFHQWSVPELPSPPTARPPPPPTPTWPPCSCRTSRPGRTPSAATPPPPLASRRRGAAGDVDVTMQWARSRGSSSVLQYRSGLGLQETTTCWCVLPW